MTTRNCIFIVCTKAYDYDQKREYADSIIGVYTTLKDACERLGVAVDRPYEKSPFLFLLPDHVIFALDIGIDADMDLTRI